MGTKAMTTRVRAFTLIELLVVIAVIGILITIVTTVGATAVRGGKGRQTRDTIRVVDVADVGRAQADRSRSAGADLGAQMHAQIPRPAHGRQPAEL